MHQYGTRRNKNVPLLEIQEIEKLEKTNRKTRRESEMVNTVVLVRDDAGTLWDLEGNLYNELGQKLDAEGNPIVEEVDVGKHVDRQERRRVDRHGRNAANPNLVDAEDENLRFGNQQGYRGFCGNGQISTFTCNQNSSGYSFTKNFEARYQAPPPPTPPSEMESMIEQILEGQEKMTVDFNGKIDALYADLNGKFEALNTHVKMLDTQVAHTASAVKGKMVHSQTAEAVKKQDGTLPGKSDANPRYSCNVIMLNGDISAEEFEQIDEKFLAMLSDAIEAEDIELPELVSIDTTHLCRSTPATTDDTNSNPDDHVDRHGLTCVDRHTPPVDPQLSTIAGFRDDLNAASLRAVVEQEATHPTPHTPRAKQRYAHLGPKPSHIIKKIFKGTKTVLQLNKPRDYRRAFVSSFDDCAGKRSIPPIPRSRRVDVPPFLGGSHASTAYTPPWMMRYSPQKYLLPPSKPPDA